MENNLIYGELFNLLLNNIYLPDQIQPEPIRIKKIEEKNFDDDFENKRKYRIFSYKQKEYCWNKVENKNYCSQILSPEGILIDGDMMR